MVTADKPDSAAERRCIVTREVCGKDELVRFVVGPGDELVADIAGKLPGRGIWVRARREAVDEAVKRGLFSRQARQSVKVPTDLADIVESRLERRCLDLVGLARRAGELVVGFDQVADALRRGRTGVLIVACDAAPGGQQKLRALLRGQGYIAGFSRSMLGRQLGREDLVNAFVGRGRLAARLLAEAGRLRGFRTFGFEPGTNGQRAEEGMSQET